MESLKGHNPFLKALIKMEDVILMTCLGVMGIVLFLQVIFRYFLGIPLMWSEELSRYLQIWLTFLGIGYGIRNSSHISMVLVYEKLPKKVQVVVSILSNIVIMVCFIVFIPGAIRFVVDQNQLNSSAMQVRMSFVYFVVPLSGFVYLVYMVADIYIKIKLLLNGRRGVIT